MFGLSRLEWVVFAATLLLVPGFSFGAGPDAAGGATAPSASLFDRLDRNRDGYLSADELGSDEAKRRNWIAVDRDRDGRISRSEFTLVAVPAQAQPEGAAAAGETAPPKKPE
jgi:hypothetical protein